MIPLRDNICRESYLHRAIISISDFSKVTGERFVADLPAQQNDMKNVYV